MSERFRRVLPDGFQKDLIEGKGQPLLKALKQFDLRIRDGAINFYSAGSSLLKVTPARLVLHAQYAKGTDFDAGNEKGYVSLRFTTEGVSRFLAGLDTILVNVRRHAKPEAEAEEQLVKENAQGTPLMVVDRQVRMPRDRAGNRLDVVAVTGGDAPMLVALELKQGLDNRIQEVPLQLDRYLRMLDPDGEGLRPDVANAYRLALKQMKALGRAAPDPELIRAGMPVRGLLVLANYNPRSRLLGRARNVGRGLHRPQFVLLPNRCDKPLPGPEEWAPLM